MAAAMDAPSLAPDVLNVAPETELDRAWLDSAVLKLTQHIDEVKGRVYEAINRDFRDFVGAFNHSLELAAGVEGLASELAVLTHKVKEGRLASLVESAREQRSLAAQLKVTNGTIGVLRALARAHEQLLEVDAKTEQGAYAAAALAVVEADQLIEQLAPSAPSGGCDMAIFGVVRDELRVRRSSLKSHLDDLWRRGVVWQRGGSGSGASVAADGIGIDVGGGMPVRMALQMYSSVPVVGSGSSAKGSVHMGELLRALATMDMLAGKLAAFAKQADKMLIVPLVTTPDLKPVIKSSGKMDTLSLKSVPSAGTGGKKINKGSRRGHAKATSRVGGGGGGGGGGGPRLAKELYATLAQTLDFVLNGLAGAGAEAGDSEVAAQVISLLGYNLYPALCTSVIEGYLADTVPAAEAQFGAHKQVAEGTVAFESRLKEMRLAPEDSTTLTDYVKNVGLHHSNKLRESLLCRAREIVLDSTFNTVNVRHATEQGGLFPHETDEVEEAEAPAAVKAAMHESIYELPACAVSQATHTLVDLVYSTLRDMASPVVTPKTAVQMFYGARDVFDLFRALTPVCHKEGLATVPQMAMVFHNDCFYLAHHALSLGHQFRDSLPDDIAKAATFIDMVPALRQLGEEHLLAMMRRQEEALAEAVASAGGMEGTQYDARYATVERTIKKCLHQLTLLSKQWISVAPEALFDLSMGALVHQAMSSFADAVLALEDVSAEETHQLNQLLSIMTERVPMLWGTRGTPSHMAATVPVWHKYTQLVEVLEASLEGITQTWRAGEYVFAPAEIRRIVKAIFENSPRRAKAIAEFV
eukprot:UC1_evm1s1254